MKIYNQLKFNSAHVFENTRYCSNKCRRLALLLVFLCFSIASFAQVAITGKIVDQESNPIVGATITEKGTQNGTSTDQDGRFRITVKSAESILVLSSVGKKTIELKASSSGLQEITLDSEDKNIDEVLVVGYGKQSRETLTTSISKLDDKVLENVSFANPASALQGTVSGVRVQSTSGQPGAAPRVIIRGGTSINNPNGASPLYIIDGVIRGNMNDINADDIASMQVLKDAASTSIYGARGSNGVVIITTKSGDSNRTKVEYSYNLGSSKVGQLYDMASARDYIYYTRVGAMVAERKVPGSKNALTQPIGYGTGNDLTNNTGFTTQYLSEANKHKLNEGWESMPDPLDPTKTIIFQETNWQDVLFQNSVTNDHHLAVSGGNDRATVNASLGYMKNNGIAITTFYDRISANLNSDLKVNDQLSVNGKVMYSYSTNNAVYSDTELFFRAAGLAPTAKYTFEDGTLAPGQGRNTGNPVYYLNRRDNKNANENLTLALSGDWTPIEGLTISPQVSLYKVAGDNYAFIHSYLNGVGNVNTTRPASAGYSKTMQTQADLTANYTKSFGNHALDAMVGFSYFRRYVFGISASGQGAATDLIPTLNASSTPVAVGGNESLFALVGYFSRLNYNYLEKYLLSITARYDGASNLGTNYRWGFFPGISAGWNVHKEPFFENVKPYFSTLKLRASYGVNGNISGLSDFHAQGSYSVGNRYLGESAVENTVLANPNLKWEQSKTLDFGVDLGFMDNRFNILFDYYNRRTDDLITNLTLPPSTGFSSISTNLGSLQNKGIELELNADIMPRSSELQWNVGFNVSTTKTKILKLPENGVLNNRVGGVYVWDNASSDYRWMGGLQEGGRIGDFYAWQQDGIYKSDAEAANAAVDLTMPFANKTKYGGDVNYADLDRNDTLDTRDLTYQGNPFPTLTGGISTSVNYKGFSLYARMDYTKGHTIYNYAKIFLSGMWAPNLNIPQEMIDKGWKQDGDIAERAQYVPGTANYSYWRGSAYHLSSTNSAFYEKGDYLTLREVTLAYQFPSAWTERIKLKNIRVNVTGSNLYYFTKYTGMNPEDGGLDQGRYPIPRNFAVGIKASF
ncbi:SusC/RagA family TonB-linked outer membrane protein [Sphingobacterium humi]|uniref:SusC/RagA family TonB-linked outer membrane protein n=1 Tax=Sphingobacterium humi TaxID=1796905 RepID=A0A6N8L598_9SPHI|nr:TonB-dependent receptor [Sphingobacterium humi]MVZ62922.1 SusC/RagA family TonB-linked outer membrane protein [Sphingobacterium humi]